MAVPLFPFRNGGGHGGGGILDSARKGLGDFRGEGGKSFRGVWFDPEEASDFLGGDKFGSEEELEASDVILLDREGVREEGMHILGARAGGGGGGGGAVKFLS